MANNKHSSKTTKPVSVLERGNPDEYRGNCTYPGKFDDGSTPWPNQIHHILVCCLFKQANIEDAVKNNKKAEFINNCLWVTDWDINKGPNLMGLPLVKAYVYKRVASLPNLPCHTVDHPKYTEEQKDWLKRNIWDPLNAMSKEHKFDVTTLEGELADAEKEWKEKLIERGQRGPGANNAWGKRLEMSDWYHPWSMADPPTNRRPPKGRKIGKISKT